MPQVDGLTLSSLIITVGDGPLRPSRDRGVLVGEGGEDGDGPPIVLQLLGAELIQDGSDLVLLLQGGAHSLAVHARAVALGLIEVLTLDADGRQDPLYIKFVGAGVVLRPAGGIGDQRDGLAQEGGQQLWLGHVLGDLAKDIVVIPAVDEANLLALAAQGTHDELHRDDLAEVPDMNRTGGGDAACTGVQLLLPFLTDDLVGIDICPVCGYNLLTHGCRL